MSRVVWQEKVEATSGMVRLVEVEFISNKYPGKNKSYVLESSRQRDAIGENIWMPVDLMRDAPRDHEAIKVALEALGHFSAMYIGTGST